MSRVIGNYGCETGDPNPPSGESGGIQIVTTDPHSGTKHFEVDAADSAVAAHRANWTGLAGANNLDHFVRFYFRKSGNPSSVVNLCTLGSLLNGHYGELQLQTNGKLKLRRNGSIDVGSESAVLDNEWHYLELRIRLGTTTTNGQIEGRIDGESFAVNNATNLGTASTVDELRIGVNNSSGGTGGTTLRYDDVILNNGTGAEDNSWPGALEANEAPVVTTKAATAVGGATATLNGTVNPKGLPTTYWFEHGTTVAYGAKTAVLEAGDGEEAVAVEAALKALATGTTYHFRLVAKNEIGETKGKDETFTTGVGPSGDPVTTTFAADHEDGTTNEWGGTSVLNGSLQVVADPPGYGGGLCLKATVTAPDGYARGQATLAQTGWKNGEELRAGIALYLPPGFYAAKQGQVDFFRWDNFEQDGVTTERGGLVFQTADKKVRIVRIQEGSPDEQHTLNLDEDENVIGPEIEEGRWYWFEFRQVLWHEDGLALTELFVDDVKVAESTERNCTRSDLVVSRLRGGIVATNGAQTNELTLYVDRPRSGPMPKIGSLAPEVEPEPEPPPPPPAGRKKHGKGKTPKLRVPLQMGETGFKVVEQGSEEEVAQCVYAILATPRGSRLEDVDFGIDDPTFDTLPIDDTEWLEAVAAYEPRADVSTAQEINDMVGDVLVGVGVR